VNIWTLIKNFTYESAIILEVDNTHLVIEDIKKNCNRIIRIDDIESLEILGENK